MKQSFNPALYCKILLGVAAVACMLPEIIGNDWEPEGVGRVVGAGVGGLFLPLLLAFIVWIVFRRRIVAANVTLIILSALLIIGALGRVGQMAAKGQAVIEMQKAQETFQDKLAEARSPEDLGSAYKEMADTATSQLEALAKQSTGVQAKGYTVLAEVTREAAERNAEWRALFAKVNGPEILDLELLARTKDYDTQLELFSTYTEHTRGMKDESLRAYDELTERLRPIGLEDKFIQDILTGYKQSMDQQLPLLTPLLDAHMAYGESLHEFISFLQRVDGQWDVVNGETRLETDGQVQAYNRIFDELLRRENTLSALDAKLIASQQTARPQ